MLKPLLIIGIGGSGGKTIRSMKQAIERKLLSVRYEGGIPDAWQFLQIDTTYDGVDFPAPMLPRDQVQLVVPPGATFQSILNSVASRATLAEQQKMLAGWGIANTAVSVKDGAGQVRGIGRQVGVADSANTLSAIQTAIAKLNSPTAMAELASVASALGAVAPDPTPQAFVISSIAGGSGAGMFIDVVEMLKRASSSQWTSEVISFLYTSEVFESLGKAGKDVSKNALGAVNELIAGKWISSTERTELLLQKLGIPAHAVSGQTGIGCKGNILIGKTNKTGIDISQGVDGTGMDEVFLTIGEALASALTSDEISQFLFQQAFVNITQTNSAIDLSGLSPENPPNPTHAAAGIGFGQLSLGADRIVEYVADALTRQQVTSLLWPELSPTLLKDGVTTNSLIKQKVEQIWPTFLSDSGLDEKGTQNQIVDALFPGEWEQEVSQFATGIIVKTVTEKDTPLARFANLIWANWETEAEDFLGKLEAKINRKAQDWVPSIQERFKEQVAREIVDNGFSVVLGLLDNLVEELRDHAMPELKRDFNDFASSVRSFDKGSFLSRVNTIAEGLSGVTTQNKAFLDKLRKDLSRVLELQIKSHVFDLAASLIDDLLIFFLDPIRKTLADNRYELQEQQKNSTLPDGSKNPFDRFPKWGSGIVPEIYKPRTIERILVDFEDYEKIYELQSKPDAAGRPSFPSSVTAALIGKKMNPKPGDENKQTLIDVRSPWSTSVRDARDQMGAKETKVDWVIKTGLLALSERNRKWLKDPDSSFGKFTTMSINDFVTDQTLDPAARAERETKFVKEFSAMLGLAQPLVSLNPQALNHVVGVSDGQPANHIMLRSSKIPFDVNSSVGKACTQVLLNNGIDVKAGNFAATWFNPASRAVSMQAAATTQTSLPAWAFASFTEPILKQVAELKNEAGTWMQFWSQRRTRPIVEAVPFEPEMRRSIVTGWFIAALLGLRKIDKVAAGKKVQIWNPTLAEPGWSDFPTPLLNSHLQDAKRDWVLPSILTSAGIAMSEFGKTGNPASIQSYLLLKYLGREVTTQLPNRDKWDANGEGDLLPTKVRSQSTILKDWFDGGQKPADALPLLKLLQDKLDSGMNRKEALTSALFTLKSEYEAAWQEFERAPWHQIPETWELKDDIDLALSDLINYVSSMQISQTSTSA